MYAGSFMSISGGESRMTIETFTAIGPCIVTKLSPMKKFQTAYEARGMSGSAAHAVYVRMHVVTTETVCYLVVLLFISYIFENIRSMARRKREFTPVSTCKPVYEHRPGCVHVYMFSL